MQDNKKEISPKIWAQIETKDGINEQVQKFRYKSFFERHKAAAAAAGAFGTVLLGLLSIGCAVMYVSEKIALATGNIYAGALAAAVILVSLEITKTYLLGGVFEHFYYQKLLGHGGKIAPLPAVGAVVLIGISALLSVLGAESFALQSADKSLEISLQGNVKVDSARAVFDSKIADLETSIKDIESGKAKRWGKLLTPSENQQILNLQARILETEAAKKAAILKQESGTAGLVSATKTDAISAANVMAMIATINEAAIILCSWFPWFFAYMVAREEKLKHGLNIGSVAGNVDNHVSIETFNGNGNGNGKLLNETKKGIGFSFGTKVANESLAKKAAVPVNEPLKNEPLRNEPLANEPLQNGLTSPPLGTIIIGKDYGNPPRLCRCGQWYHWKLAHKENCGSDCQVKNWETKTGKKIIPGRKR